MARSCVSLGILVAVLITINAHSSEAAMKITKCWDGWATGTDLMKTNRNTSEKACPADTKYCSKWYLMTSKAGLILFINNFVTKNQYFKITDNIYKYIDIYI